MIVGNLKALPFSKKIKILHHNNKNNVVINNEYLLNKLELKFYIYLQLVLYNRQDQVIY